MAKRYDLIIIGSGPAGLAAAIYAQRARLNTLVLEKEMMSGGQVLNTYEVDNYPGLPGINGFELGTKFRQHADGLEAVFAEDEVLRIELLKTEERLQAAELRLFGLSSGQDERHDLPEALVWKQVVGKRDVYQAKAVIVAAGATHRKLGVPGEEELAGKGISYCATCDGAFFKRKVTAVIGGGDVALEDAVFLSRMCERVYLIHRRDQLRGAKSLQEKVFATENITVIWDTVVERILGEEMVRALSLRNKKTGEAFELALDGVFIAVGITPNTRPYEGLLELENGYIRADEEGNTSVPGIYAAGDARTKRLRQIVTAVADGANAVTSAERYLIEH